MRPAITAAVLVLLLWTSAARAQVLVEEVGPNLFHNIVTSIQSTISAIEAVAQTANMILELTPYDDNGLAGLEADLMELDGIVQEASMVLYDIGEVERQSRVLFGLDAAPSSTAELQARLWEIRRVRAEQLMQARRIQTLQATAVRTVARILHLAGRILDFVGQKQAMQNISANLTVLKHIETQQGVQVAAFQQALLTGEQERPLIEESVQRINVELLADWPRN